MIRADELLCIGYIKRPHGFKGNLHIELSHEIALEKGDFVFLKLEGKFIPFPIESIGAGKNTNTFKLGFINDHDKAVEMVGAEVYVRAEDIPEDDELSLLGYAIVDKHKGKLGKVKHIEYFPQQIMLILEYKGEDRFIPLNDNFVKNISHDKAEIFCDLPDGLLDI